MPLLTDIASIITIYIGMFIYLFGIFGSLLNIHILLPSRSNPCTFILIYSSMIDICVLNIGLLPRILSVGFHTDFTLSNIVWCKFRTYCLRITTLIALYTVSLMSIDRFFISCRTVRWRHWSNIRFVHWTTFLMSLIIAIEGLPFLILTKITQINNTTACTPMHNSLFSDYASFFCIPVLFGILPLSIMAAMGILIYFKLHNRAHLRRVQRSLTLTILLRILLAFISCAPYTSYFVYSAITHSSASAKSTERIDIENFVLSILSILLYITYSSSFFVHCSISSTYRKQVIDLLYHRCRGREVVHPPQQPTIQPIQRNGHTAVSNSRTNRITK